VAVPSRSLQSIELPFHVTQLLQHRAGVIEGVAVALKNGSLPLNNFDTDWQRVYGGDRDYLVAMFSTNNPSKE
jgi:hypothetical protein